MLGTPVDRPKSINDFTGEKINNLLQYLSNTNDKELNKKVKKAKKELKELFELIEEDRVISNNTYKRLIRITRK